MEKYWLSIPSWVRFWILIPAMCILSVPFIVVAMPFVLVIGVVGMMGEGIWVEWKKYKRETD